jgi:hypothetical protein
MHLISLNIVQKIFLHDDVLRKTFFCFIGEILFEIWINCVDIITGTVLFKLFQITFFLLLQRDFHTSTFLCSFNMFC